MTNLYIGSWFFSLTRRSFHCLCICLCSIFFFFRYQWCPRSDDAVSSLVYYQCFTSRTLRLDFEHQRRDFSALLYFLSPLLLQFTGKLQYSQTADLEEIWYARYVVCANGYVTGKVAGTDGMTSEGLSTVLGADARRTHLPRLMTPRGIPVGVLKAGSSFSPSSNTLSLNNWREKNTKVLKYATKLYLIIQYLTYCIYTTATVILYLKCNTL